MSASGVATHRQLTWAETSCGAICSKIRSLVSVVGRVDSNDSMRCDAMRCDAMRCDAM